MIEVKIPKDVSVYESTLIGPLTSRQTVCLAIAAGIEFVYYNVIQILNLNATIDMNALLCIGIVLAAPILYMAIGKPYGMRPETYLYYFLLPSLVGQKNRPYETKLTYDSILDEIEKQEAAAEAAKNSKGKQKGKQKDVKKTKQKTKTKGRSKQDIMYL